MLQWIKKRARMYMGFQWADEMVSRRDAIQLAINDWKFWQAADFQEEMSYE